MPQPQPQPRLPAPEQAWASRDPAERFRHSYAPSPVAAEPRRGPAAAAPAPAPAQPAQSRLRERPGSASAVRLAVASAKQDPRRLPPAQSVERSPLAPLDTNGSGFGEGVSTRSAARKEPLEMLQVLEASGGGINVVDLHGWSALHWTALEGKVDHVAALLDSGADAARGSTSLVRQMHTHGVDRAPGTLPEDLARHPAEGRRSHGPVLKMLIAAAKGSWDERREHKRKGDAAMASNSLHEAREHYNKAFRAVPTFMEDSAVYPLSKLRREIEDAIKGNELQEQERRQREAERRQREDERERRDSGKHRRHSHSSSASDSSSSGGGAGSRDHSSRREHMPESRPPSGDHRTPPLQRGTQRGSQRGQQWSPQERSPYAADVESMRPRRKSSGTPPHLSTPESARSSSSALSAGSAVASSVSSPARSDEMGSAHSSGGSHRKRNESEVRRSEQLSNAVRCGDTKLTVGDAAGAIAAVETGMRACYEMGVADLLRRACAQLESEMRAARDYAHRRDSEVYELSVAKKSAEDDANSIREAMNDEVESLQTSLSEAMQSREELSREMEDLRRSSERGGEELARAQARENEMSDSWQKERGGMRSEIQRLTARVEDLQQQLQETTEIKASADAMCARSADVSVGIAHS